MDHAASAPSTHHGVVYSANVFAAVAWIADAFYRYGPSWSLVPPLLLAGASLVGAIRSYQDGAQARRHAEEKHRAELALLSKRTAFDPLLD